jgi:hypothetical protein
MTMTIVRALIAACSLVLVALAGPAAAGAAVELEKSGGLLTISGGAETEQVVVQDDQASTAIVLSNTTMTATGGCAQQEPLFEGQSAWRCPSIASVRVDLGGGADLLAVARDAAGPGWFTVESTAGGIDDAVDTFMDESDPDVTAPYVMKAPSNLYPDRYLPGPTTRMVFEGGPLWVNLGEPGGDGVPGENDDVRSGAEEYGFTANTDIVRAGAVEQSVPEEMWRLLAGNDFVNPGDGKDYVFLGVGDDRVELEDGATDTVDCGAGYDRVLTHDFWDTLIGCEDVEGGGGWGGGSSHACSDGLDNDGDGLTDEGDTGCYTDGVYNPEDSSELLIALAKPECMDGEDNDGDGLFDADDPGCLANGVWNPFDNGELNGPAEQDPNGEDPSAEDPNGEDPNGEDPNGQDPTGQPGANDPPAAIIGPNSTPVPPGNAVRPNPDVACANGQLRLIDVYRDGKRVRIYGVAPPGTVGETVTLRYLATGKRVATAKVGADLSFGTWVKAPTNRVSYTSKARYRARLGKRHRSQKLKLHRRAVVETVKRKGDRIVFGGRLVKPLPRDGAQVRLRMGADCATVGTAKVVKRLTVGGRGGKFRFSVKVPQRLRSAAAVYLRADSRVAVARKSGRGEALAPTFTLTRGVALR